MKNEEPNSAQQPSDCNQEQNVDLSKKLGRLEERYAGLRSTVGNLLGLSVFCIVVIIGLVAAYTLSDWRESLAPHVFTFLAVDLFLITAAILMFAMLLNRAASEIKSHIDSIKQMPNTPETDSE